MKESMESGHFKLQQDTSGAKILSQEEISMLQQNRAKPNLNKRDSFAGFTINSARSGGGNAAQGTNQDVAPI